MPDEPEGRDERLATEAEELMRQRRYRDAAQRYHDLRRANPSDLWASLAHASALECAGEVDLALKILDDAANSHRAAAPVHRFRQLFFTRREDHRAAAQSQAALEAGTLAEGAPDQLADLYFNQGRYLEARAELERLLRHHDGHDQQMRASIFARLGACHRHSGELEEARTHLVQALALEDDSAWTLSELAETERALGDADAARRHYLRALELKEEDHWTRGHLAQLEVESGHVGRGVQLYEQILAAEPKAGWAKVELAQVLANRNAEGDRKRATDLLRSALADDPDYPWAHAQLGQIARRDGRHGEAREHYRRAAAIAPGSLWILHELADSCRHLGKFDDAFEVLDRAAAAEPYDAATCGYRADFLRQQGRSDEARRELERAVQLDPNYAWAWRELAELKALAGDHAGAEECYRQAVRCEPDEAVNDGLRAFLLRLNGQREAALPWLQRALEHQPDYLWAWRELSESHLAAGRDEAATATAEQALAHVGESAVLLGLLAESERRRGLADAAAKHVARAIELDPRLPHLHGLQAELRLEANDPAGALAAIDRGMAVERNPELALLRAQALATAGRIADAAAETNRLLALPNPPLPTWELAAALRERQGDATGASALCDRGISAGVPDPRLLVRRARLGLDRGETGACARLVPLLAEPAQRPGPPIPWREMAQLFVSARQPLEARQAAHALLAQGRNPAAAWTVIAETELGLGDLAGARTAAARALDANPDHAPTLVLAAVLADQHGDGPAAIAHLQRLDRLVCGESPAVGDAAPAVLRQLAALHERLGQDAEALRTWGRLVALRPDDAALAAERAAFLVRSKRADDPAVATALAGDLARPEGQRLVRELALARAQAGEAKAAADFLAKHDAVLDAGNRLLLAQLHLAGDRPQEAARQLAQVRAGSPDRELGRSAALLEVRALLAGRQLDRAAGLAARLWADALAAGQADEDTAVLHAECLAAAARCREALAVLDHPTLPARPGLERGLLATCLAGELGGETALLLRLGRLERPAPLPPLARLFAIAWPDAWPAGPESIALGDTLCLPPLPRLGLIVASALERAGRVDLAVRVLLGVARSLSVPHRDAARPLNRAAVAMLCRAGARLTAWREAWRAADVPALLRCCLPW